MAKKIIEKKIVQVACHPAGGIIVVTQDGQLWKKDAWVDNGKWKKYEPIEEITEEKDEK